jgi:hypothetical protein
MFVDPSPCGEAGEALIPIVALYVTLRCIRHESERDQRFSASGILVSLDKSDSVRIALLSICANRVSICMMTVFVSFRWRLAIRQQHADENSRGSTDHSLPSRLLRVEDDKVVSP